MTHGSKLVLSILLLAAGLVAALLWCSPATLRNLTSVTAAVSAVALPILAVVGLLVWRRPAKAQRQYDVAQELRMTVYKVGEAIRKARAPEDVLEAVIVTAHFLDEQRETPPYSQRKSAVYARRHEHLMSAVNELVEVSVKARIYLGKEIGDATNEFLGLGMEVSLALALAVSKGTELPAERRESTDPFDLLEEEHRLVGRVAEDGEEDVFSRRVDTALEKIESLVRKFYGNMRTVGRAGNERREITISGGFPAAAHSKAMRVAK